MNLHIAQLPHDFLTRVRERGLDDQLQPVRRTISAEGGEPCRDVLRRARPGEAIILASYCPFTQAGPYKEFGPVFVLAHASDEPVDRHVLPLPNGSPERYLGAQFALRAYGLDESILDGELTRAEEAEHVIERFLSRPDVAFVQARFPAHGCFAARIERA